MKKRGETATRFGAGLLVLILVLTMVPAVAAATPITIYDIQYTTDPGGDSPHVGEEVVTQGIVTATFADFFFIQDGTGPWSGLTLYRPNGAMAVGDLVEATGEVSEYSGLTEIAYGDVVVVSSGNPVPAAEVLATGDVAQEQWESVFVRVEAVTVTDDDLGYGEWAIDDGSGPVVVDDLGSFTYTPTDGDALVYVQGPLPYTYGAFKIEPRDDGDIGLSGLAPEATISEIRIDQPSTDNDEYFELAAEDGTDLTGLSYIVIGDSSGGASGVVEAVVDLSGSSVPAGGFFVAAEDTFALGTADLTANLNFENSDNVTHLLVWEFTGSDGDDLDTDDDGVLDSEPWSQVVDCVALVETVGSGEQLYCETQVGPDGTFVPGHAYTCFGGWVVGEFDPAAGDDTPGAANACDLPIPEVGINEVRIDQPSTDNDEYFELAGEAGTALAGLSYVVLGDSSGGGSGVVEAVVDLAGSSVPAGGFFVAAEDTFTLGTADLTANLNFENSDNVTHLLVWEFTGDNGDDLDTDDDGVLDSEPWTEVVDCVALVETVDSGDLLYCDTQVGPDGTFVPGHIFLCEEGWEIGGFSPEGGADTPGMANICEECGDPFTTIYDIQGSGESSTLLDSVVSLEGVVTGDFQEENQLRGFFVQDAAGDGDATTSDGVFVYAPGALDVEVGDAVRVRGLVQEYDQQTEIGNVSFVLSCGEGVVTPTVVDLPASLEPYEGMLVTFPEELTVSQNYFQGRYGQVTLSSEGRLFQPTNTYLPGSAEAIGMAAENMLRMIELDDGSTWSNPGPIPYIGAGNTLRAGDTISGLTGVVDQGKVWTGDPKLYRLQPTMPVEFTRVNERTSAPAEVGGLIRIGAFNVLNYFNGDGLGGGFPTSRGASSPDEFVRQRDKIISAILALDPDVLGLMEIENDGYGPESAIADLVNGLNAAAGASTYAFIDPGVAPVGTDEIVVGFIYKPATVNPVGAAAILDSFVDPLFNSDKNRPAIAQTFERATGGARFTAAVNHLKSKGSACDDVGDPEDPNGQGNCNVTRTNAAIALANWLATDPTGSGDPDLFIIGDLNAYAMEDPITALEAAGYTNLVKAFDGMWAYSYTFDGQAGYLDHGLGSASAAYYTLGATIWHINTDEPSVLDYNVEYKSQDFYEPTPFRASDHDPVLIGFCDDVPPGLDVTVTPDLLWPVNHKYVTVTATVDVWDNLDENPMLELVSVTSSEPDNDIGDGHTEDDIVIVDDFTFLLRAERAGGGDGRIYTITYKATDVCGNETWARAFVTVPHDQRKEK